ncbi:RHS repeat-associated core domain-containing protein, partial [Xenorhabdus szentirmaii]|uniref:RHS repeat-associated core domain-containing protein n=1 Tax=Xenorhabdus szentirmaii TaxID=290112 RepID=UPI0019BB465E
NCNFRFAGQYEDEESGLYYNRFRYYNPEVAQYISPDPLNLRGGLNPYGYVYNPTGWIDPCGLSDSSILDKAMAGKKYDRLSAHHVIPVEIWTKHQEFLNQIGIGGRMNSVENGIHIPGSKKAMKDDVGKGMKVFHSSNHNTYSGQVDNKIAAIKAAYEHQDEKQRITAREARDRIRKVQMEMKNRIWSGNVPTNTCKRLN